MGLVFGRRYHENTDSHKAKELNELVKEASKQHSVRIQTIQLLLGRVTLDLEHKFQEGEMVAILWAPLSSWARLPTSDVQLSNGMVVPSGITAMVNMYATIHDPNIREDPLTFKPERFQDNDFDVRGTDLRLEPFGAGQRVCPGRNLGLAVVTLWVARLVQHFQWIENKDDDPVNLEEVLKLSCEMKKPICVVVVPTNTRSMFSP
ncbi:hypothetical protein Ancab_036218 [Ancistrocladus abbreviatus]